MTENRLWKTAAAVLLLAIFLAVCAAAAFAEDEELLKRLPGQWAFGTYEESTVTGSLTLGENGELALFCTDREGGYVCSYEGEWAFELVPDDMDRLTLRFTWTDHPAHEDGDYSVECAYTVYTEGWVENDTEHTALILENESVSGGESPFIETFGESGEWPLGFEREQGPNMRVVNCKEFVSLRAKRSASSARLAKVPLGALVLAYPDAGEEGGFLLCSYHDEYGYILAKYLEPVE